MADQWSYKRAFSRNLGLISPEEQQKLRASRVAIPGMGGVGGVHLVTLARLGVGAFRVADPDTFDVVNFNRQIGAETVTVGQAKAEVMQEAAQRINPELKIESLTEPITQQNVDSFLQDVDILIDAVDFFAFDARRLLFQKARERGIWAVTAGPIGFSTAWLCFDPHGMSFDEYFDMHDGMSDVDKFSAFAVGLAPRATHFGYIDLSYVNASEATGPSLALACQLASGVAAAETAKILLGRKPLRPAPCYAQFDAYRCILRRGRLWWGNRHPLQRLKRAVLRRRMKQLGYGADQE